MRGNRAVHCEVIDCRQMKNGSRFPARALQFIRRESQIGLGDIAFDNAEVIRIGSCIGGDVCCLESCDVSKQRKCQ